METKTNLIEPLLERAVEYSKNSLELLKLKSLAKTADVSSLLISKMLFLFVISFFCISLTIAAGLWLGELLGKNYYGFMVVTAFYGLLGGVLFLMHPYIKRRVNNSIVNKLLN